MNAIVDQALKIAGAEDLSDGGENGVLIIEANSDFAEAIIKALRLAPQYEGRFRGHDFRLTRNSSIELWCNGWYSEGTSVRHFIHRGAKILKESVHA